MAFSRVLLVSLSIVGIVLGQNANGTAAGGELGIEVIQANFKQAAISGQNNLVPDFEPSALLTASFPGLGAVNPGQELNVEQSKSAPTLSIKPANSSVSLSGNYTLMMVDADVVGAAANSNTRHWLVNGVTVTSDTISNSTANAPEPYMGPFPDPGSGKHRYVLLVYEQPANFSNPAEFQGGIHKINLQEYVQSSGLGHLVAATYIQVQQGSASSSASVTSAVVTSTLPAAQSTTGASGTAGTTGTGAGSAGSPTPTGGASVTSATSFLTLAFVMLNAVFIF